MTQIEKVAVTGAFSYTGKYIARHLLDQGRQVLNLTRDPFRKSEFSQELRSSPFNFDNPSALIASLEGCSTLYSTYWIRFNYKSWTFDQAVENTSIMIQAARQAGVRRIVHISVSNPSLDSPLAYFRGKAELEAIVQDSGLSYAIIRPTLIFGKEDLLLNNIATCLEDIQFFRSPAGVITAYSQFQLKKLQN